MKIYCCLQNHTNGLHVSLFFCYKFPFDTEIKCESYCKYKHIVTYTKYSKQLQCVVQLRTITISLILVCNDINKDKLFTYHLSSAIYVQKNDKTYGGIRAMSSYKNVHKLFPTRIYDDRVGNSFSEK